MASAVESENASRPYDTDSESNAPSPTPLAVSSYPMQELTLEPKRLGDQGPSLSEDKYLDKEYFNGPKSASSSTSAFLPSGPPSTTNLVAYRDDPDSMFQGGQATFLPDYSQQQKHGFFSSVRKNRRRARIFIGIAVISLLTLIGVITALIYMFATKRHQDSDPSANSPGTLALHPTEVTGGDGSTVTRDDGSTFAYKNSFGGTWYYDPSDPFNNGARAQSWSPALNETFRYGTDPIRGVNLGGWLVTEPFIAPALFEKYLNNPTPAVDEWTLSENMRNDTSGGGISQLEDHYKTFITEDDFAAIAGAGLNFVRIPIPYWAIETRDDEPFLAKTSWTYFLRAVEWARKYGLRINVDLHTLPGSQNGWNHSGKDGSINVLYGPMGFANAQRSLDYIRIIAEFISQPQYKDVIVMFGITNEPQASVDGIDVLKSYYLEGYNVVRAASGVGEGKGPYVSIHDGFVGASEWVGFLPGADRLALDMHKYTCFGPQPTGPLSSMVNVPCAAYASMVNETLSDFGLVTAGEFSNAVMDCGLYVNGVNVGSRYDGSMSGTTKVGSCDPWLDWANWDDATKHNYMTLARSSMDSLQNWFFWTWKIGNSSVHGTVMSPHWSYQLGLENGWMPTDPRSAVGTCGNKSPFDGPLKNYQTGGAGAGDIPASATADIPWPPASLSNAGAVSLLPSYTPTGSLVTLPDPTFTASASVSVDAGSGWTNPDDKAGMMVPIEGCSYLDPWVGNAKTPSPLCSANVAVAKPAVANRVVASQTATPSTVSTVSRTVETSISTVKSRGLTPVRQRNF